MINIDRKLVRGWWICNEFGISSCLSQRKSRNVEASKGREYSHFPWRSFPHLLGQRRGFPFSYCLLSFFTSYRLFNLFASLYLFLSFSLSLSLFHLSSSFLLFFSFLFSLPLSFFSLLVLFLADPTTPTREVLSLEERERKVEKESRCNKERVVYGYTARESELPFCIRTLWGVEQWSCIENERKTSLVMQIFSRIFP